MPPFEELFERDANETDEFAPSSLRLGVIRRLKGQFSHQRTAHGCPSSLEEQDARTQNSYKQHAESIHFILFYQVQAQFINKDVTNDSDSRVRHRGMGNSLPDSKLITRAEEFETMEN